MRESRAILPIVLGLGFLGLLSGRRILPEQAKAQQLEADRQSSNTALASQRPTIDESHLQRYLSGSRVHHFIVTVPDPTCGMLNNGFDLTIDAVQRAMSTCGFVPIGYDIPWDAPRPALAVANPTPSGGGAPNRRPGRIYFYRSKSGKEAPAHACVIYLVPETPTHGVSAEALCECLDSSMRNRMVFLNPSEPTNWKVRILGPRYSGSAQSLANILTAWNGAGANIELISGTATSVGEEFGGDQKEICFCSTVHRDKQKWDAVVKFLTRYSRGSIALLSESGTGFGGAWRTFEPGGLEVVHIPYPLHVACARSAMESETRGGGPKLDLFQDLRHRLTIPTTDEAISPDVVPPFCPRMTAAYFEMVFSQIVSKLHQARVEWVGIVGTDIRDMTFLAKLLHVNAPDVRLFFLESDVLLAHPSLSDVLRGSLVFGSYPLSMTARENSTAQPCRISFASQSQEGVYNAMLALMVREFNDTPSLPAGQSAWARQWADQMLDYDHSTTTGDPHEYIWASMVGSGELWPLERLPLRAHGPGEEYLFSKEANSSSRPLARSNWLPIPAGLTMAGLLVLLLLNITALTIWPYRGSRIALLPRWPAFWSNPECFQGRQIAWAAGGLAVLTALLLYLLSLATAGLYSPISKTLLVIPVPLLLLLVLAGLDARAMHGRLPWFRVPGAIAAAAILVLGIIVACGFLFHTGESVLQYRVHRAFALSGEVSPVVPAVLLGMAIYFWCLSEVKRIWLNAQFPKDAPSNTFESGPWPDTPEFRVFHEASTRALDVSSSPIRQYALLIVPILATVVAALVVGIRVGLPVEGRLYSLLIGLGMATVFFSCLWALARFWRVWRNVRHMLRAVAWSPVVGAMDYLPEKVSQAVGPYFFARRPRSFQFRALLSHLDQDLGREYERALRKELETGQFASPELLKLCLDKLAYRWKRLPRAWARRTFAVNYPDPPSDAQRQKREASRAKSQTQRLDNSLAICLVWYIVYWFLQLRNLMISMSISALLLLLAVASYPFQPHRLLTLFPWLLILTIALVVLTVFVQTDRDEVISRITRTRPNRLSFNRNFIAAVATFVLPLLAVVAAQFPEVSGLLSKWMAPLVTLQ